MVVLKGNEHINNHHQITNNHFGPRPRKGGPHGETIQIGDSGTSMSPSFTMIANNFFERCDGEVEIISNKSNYNEYRNNIFYKSEGSLMLRHGNYCTIDASLIINKLVTIKSKDKKSKATLVYKGQSKSPVFLMEPKGNLRLENMILKGDKEQYAFATLEKNMKSAYNLWVNNVEINEFDTVLNAYEDAFADTISIDNSIIKNCKRGIRLADENDDLGEYNAEFVYIKNTKFDAIQSSVLDYYRGGYDESTIGGNLVFDNNTVTNSGKEEQAGILIKTRGIVNVSIAKNNFTNNPIALIALLWGEKGQATKDNNIKNSGEFKIE